MHYSNHTSCKVKFSQAHLHVAKSNNKYTASLQISRGKTLVTRKKNFQMGQSFFSFLHHFH